MVRSSFVLLRRLPPIVVLVVLVALFLGAPACTPDVVDLTKRQCGYLAPDSCDPNGCVRFCSEADGCLCLNSARAACDQSCTSGCTEMESPPSDDADVPGRFACTQAIRQALAERASYAPQ